MGNDVKLLRDLNFDLVNYFANTIIPQLFVDADMVLRIFTPPAMKQFSLSSEDINKSFLEVKDNIRYPTIIQNVEEVIATNEILEKEIQTEDGKWFQMNILPYTEHKTGKLNGVIITFVDITTRLSALRELEQLNARHEVLMFALSHDLRQPLTTITLLKNGLQQAFQKGDEKQFTHWLNSLNSAMGNINSLLDGFTADTKSSPTPKQNATRVNIEEISKNVLDALRNEIKNNNVKVITNFQTSEILFPRNNLRSVVYNLIHNAIKFRDQKTPVIKIFTYKEEEHVILKVEDNGIGIAQEDQKSIFNKSVRIHPHIEGTGLGLFIIKRMLNLHDGRIELKSSAGKGCTFKVIFKSGYDIKS